MTTTDYGFDDLQIGDTVIVERQSALLGAQREPLHIKGEVIEAGHGTQPKIRSAFGVFYADRVTDAFELIERPKPTLPDRPGTVGVATINGRRVRVMLCQDGSGTRVWACASPTTPNPVSGVYLAADEAITDFELLDVCREGLLA